MTWQLFRAFAHPAIFVPCFLLFRAGSSRDALRRHLATDEKPAQQSQASSNRNR
jgi:hypothetical protein